jgi:hypothetical protein
MGIYVTYVAVGLLQEWLIKYPYKNTLTGLEDYFYYPVSLILFPHLATYIIGSFYNIFWIDKS